ncbi:MAG TPA: hypothetical protein VN927_05720 [Gemmatimonadaceae bacterium]|nr:hypothetical protein [Gemmatimonadaceae bacterium]
MKVLVITLALAGLASTATLNAQTVSGRVSSTNQVAIGNGSWTVIGRDRTGPIYERRIQDRNGNIIVQRARRGVNGNLSIYSTQTVGNGNTNNRNNGCAYNQTTNSVGDIIFGRTNANTCQDVYSRDDGAWYQVGQGGNNNSIYERRTVDARGNVVIQRARRNSNGTFTILSTRGASTNDKQWKRAQQQQEKDLKKGQKEQQKQMKNNENHR